MKLCAKSDFGAVEYRLAALRPEGEAVAWIYEDELPASYPYDAMWPHSEVRSGVRMFPVYGPAFVSPPAPAGVKVKVKTSPAAQGTVAGWKLVPVEPTEEQIEAMCNAYRTTRRAGVSGMTLDAQFRVEFAQWFAAYSAMLSASPSPEALPASGVEPACWTSEVSLKMAAQGLPALIHAYPPPVEPVALYRQPLTSAPAPEDRT